jgi:hypothetical protein
MVLTSIYSSTNSLNILLVNKMKKILSSFRKHLFMQNKIKIRFKLLSDILSRIIEHRIICCNAIFFQPLLESWHLLNIKI